MRSVLLLTIDSLRADHLSVHGHGRETTPRIDSLAREGIDFTHAFSQGTTTSMSFLALLGGIYPLANQAWMESPPNYPRLTARAPALAAVLQGAGFRTGGWHSNPLLSRFYGYSRGFDEFFDSIPDWDAGQGFVYRKWHRCRFRKAAVGLIKRSPRLYRSLRGAKDRFIQIGKPFEGADVLHEKAIGFISRTDGPFFAWLHYMDLHYPYLPSPEEVRDFTGLRMTIGEINRLNRSVIDEHPSSVPTSSIEPLKAIYDTQINKLDGEIGRFLDVLDENGHLDDAIVVLTADHGDQFMEHGHVGHWNNVWYYDELLRVPLIVRGIGCGRREGLSALVDLPPSICRWAGADPHPDMMGRSLDVARDVVFAGGEMDGTVRMAIRTRKRKFILDEGSGAVELYDLEADPAEQENIATSSVEGVKAFRELASGHIEEARRHNVRMGARAIAK